MEHMKVIFTNRRCDKCSAVIARTYRIDTGTAYHFEVENTPERFIDKWGFGRNFCKKCMKEKGRTAHERTAICIN